MDFYTKTILMNVPSAILVADTDNKIVFANTAFGKLARERFHDLIGKTSSEALSELQKHWELIADEFSMPLKDSEKVKNPGLRKGNSTNNKDRDPLTAQSSDATNFTPLSVVSLRGEIFTYRIFDAGVTSNGVQLKGLILNDFTEEKDFYDRMTQAENISSLKTLAAGISHEISNPLHSILTFSEAISEESNLDKIRLYSEKVVNNSARLGKILADFSGYVQTKENGTKKEVNIIESIKTALKFAMLPYSDNKIILEENYKSIPVLMADPEEIQQIFFNIINNAFQAMNNNGRLKVSTRENENSLVISFKDNGHGMPEDILRKATNPFFTTKMQGEGTGLGLNISQRLIEKYGGRIELRSLEGEGTDVTIYLPNHSKL